MYGYFIRNSFDDHLFSKALTKCRIYWNWRSRSDLLRSARLLDHGQKITKVPIVLVWSEICFSHISFLIAIVDSGQLIVPVVYCIVVYIEVIP